MPGDPLDPERSAHLPAHERRHLDIARLRADTPGCEQVVHLNNAGAALSPQVVVDAVVAHLNLEARIGGYEAEARSESAVTDTRSAVAELLHVDPLDIALTPNDTTSWAKAFWGLAMSGWFDGGGRVLVDHAMYNSHYLALLQARDRLGVSIEVIGEAESGSIDLEDLDRRLDGSVRLVTVTHVGTHRGLVNPVAEVGRRTALLGVPFFLDACQSVGQLPVDLTTIGCDVATGTGRKFLRGPRGTGWLFVAPEWSERMRPVGIDGASATWSGADSYEFAPRARRFEEFEHSRAARIGFGVAVRYALDTGIDLIAARIDELSEHLRDALTRAGAEVHDGGRRRCGIVTFTVPGHEPDDVRTAAAAAGINLSVTTAAMARLDMDSRGLAAAVRASPHAYNSVDELDRLAALVEALGPST